MGEAETETAVLAGAHRVRQEGDAVAVPVARLHRVAEIELVPAAGVRGVSGGVAHPAGVAPDPDVQAHPRPEDRREPVREVHPHGDRVVGPERRDLAVGVVRAGVRRDRDRLDPRIAAHLQGEDQVGRAVEAVRRPQRVALPRQRAAIGPRDRRRGRVQRIARPQRPRRRHRIANVVRISRVRHLRQPVVHRRARVEENGRTRHPGEGRRRRVHLVAGLGAEAVQLLGQFERREIAAGHTPDAAPGGAGGAQRVLGEAHAVGVAVAHLHDIVEIEPRAIKAASVAVSPVLVTPGERARDAADRHLELDGADGVDLDTAAAQGPAPRDIHRDGFARQVGVAGRGGSDDARIVQVVRVGKVVECAAAGMRRRVRRGQQEGEAQEGRGAEAPSNRALHAAAPQGKGITMSTRYAWTPPSCTASHSIHELAMAPPHPHRPCRCRNGNATSKGFDCTVIFNEGRGSGGRCRCSR